jgi:hypothetical protein
MPINSFYETSDLSIQKSLIDLAIANKVFQEENQPDEAIFTPSDKRGDIRNAVRDKNI